MNFLVSNLRATAPSKTESCTRLCVGGIGYKSASMIIIDVSAYPHAICVSSVA